MGGPAGTADDGDPNEHDPNTYEPNDNFGGLGMSPAVAQLTFNSGDQQKSMRFTIDEPQPGNNFIMGVHHSLAVLDRYRFEPSGISLYVLDEGEQETIWPPHRSDMLTVSRTLWMELDDMVAPDPDPTADGPFDGAGVGNDDVQLDPPLPPIGLTESSMQWILIDVKPLPAQPQYNDEDATPNDDTGTVEFRHNLASGGASNFLGAVRDVASARDFWVVHTVGAYEEEKVRDYDPDGSVFRIGYAYGMMTDEPNGIFFETIRDVATNYPGGTAGEQTIRDRIVLHEALHRFLGPHGSPEADEGVMNVEPTLLTGTAQQNELTPRQIRLINERDYPGNPGS